MKNKLPIKQVKVYQSVTFEGAQNSYFTPSSYMSIRTSKPEIQIEELENGAIVVTSDRDCIKIGIANIAFIQYDLEKAAQVPVAPEKASSKAK